MDNLTSMELDVIEKLKIIKSVQKKNSSKFEETVYFECCTSEEVLYRLEELQTIFEANPSFEKLHGLENHLSLSYRHLDTQDEIKFYASD